MGKNVLIFKQLEMPKEAGVYYRLICLTGQQKGESYILIGNRVIIGRGEDCDIILNDTKISREHVEITKVGEDFIVTDLGSQNGIIVNEQKVKQEKIIDGDKLIVGHSVLKFSRIEVSPKKQVIKEQNKNDFSDEVKPKSKISQFVMIALAVLSVLFLIDDQPAVKSKRKENQGKPDVSSEYAQALQKKIALEDKEIKEKINVIYQRGLRELREKNYFRAISEFNLALIIAPGDSQAEFYLRKTKEELDKTIESFIVKAQRDEEALKFKGALVAYCSITRLLYTVPNDPRYKNAEEKIKDLEFKLGMEPGETNCLKRPGSDTAN